MPAPSDTYRTAARRGSSGPQPVAAVVSAWLLTDAITDFRRAFPRESRVRDRALRPDRPRRPVVWCHPSLRRRWTPIADSRRGQHRSPGDALVRVAAPRSALRGQTPRAQQSLSPRTETYDSKCDLRGDSRAGPARVTRRHEKRARPRSDGYRSVELQQRDGSGSRPCPSRLGDRLGAGVGRSPSVDSEPTVG